MANFDDLLVERFDQLQLSDAIPEKSDLQVIFEAKNEKFCMWPAEDLNADSLLIAQQNPTEWEEHVPTEWNRFVSPGASYSHVHYTASKNYTVDLELHWWAFDPIEAAECYRARKLLLGWCYPEYNEQGWSLGPPQLFAVWPGAFDLKCYLIDCKIRNLKFSRTGEPIRWVASLKLEECIDAFVSSGAVANPKTIRGQEVRWRRK